MTRDQALAELDQRFAAYMLEETQRMRAEGLGDGLIVAIVTENYARFAARREQAADWIVSEDLDATTASGTLH